jgi:predicted ATPase/DNA-binding XRE family transcriptional regulator
MEKHSFGYWLRLKRKALDLTQDGLADRVGCSVAMIRKIESEERRPSAQIIERLAEILNISEEERTAFLRFARGDWHSAPFAIKDDLPWKAPAKRSHTNLPATTTSLIGRQKEIALLHGYLRNNEIRLVTLIGPPGIGKTRLSIETARTALPNFPDGIFFVALAPLEEPSLIAMTIAQMLGFIEVRNVSPEELLKEGIGEKEMLLVLDNSEHLIGGVASIASDLLSACPRLKILVTSRESLRVSGEWLYTVPAFDLPAEHFSVDVENVSQYPALVLFAERARAVRADFSLTSENIEAVTAICARLDGLPLVIELMAARMRLMSPQALLDRLTGQFVLTADGMRAASERQKTLRNAIDWSYSLLSEQEQKLFVYLSVFSGSFTLAEAEAIFAHTVSEKSVPELLTLLLDKSLIRRVANESREDRYDMLMTIQEYALERLRGSGEEIEIRNRHLAYFSELAKQARLHLQSADQLEWLDRLDAEYDNIRVALNWAQTSGAIAEGLWLVTDLQWFWIWRVHVQEPCLALENLFTKPLPADQIQALARGHCLAGVLKWNSSDKKPSEAHFKESERLSLLLGPEGKVDLAWARHMHHTFTQSAITETPIQIRQRYNEVLKLFQEAGDPCETASMLSDMGLELGRSGDFIGTRQALEQSLRVYRECGDRISASRTNVRLAYFALDHGTYAETRPQLEEILHFCQQARLNFFMDMPLWLLGVIAVREGDYVRAKEWYKECLLFDQQIGLPRQFAECFIGFAGIASAEQDFERAAQLLSVGEAEAEARANPLENIDQIELKRLTAVLREELGDVKFEALASQGRAMARKQAIAYALQE